MKKETKPAIAVKDARSDSSFFSAPKPKAKLPSFKKAPVPVKREPDLNIAQPSSIDPFQEALKSMGKGRRDSPATPTPPPASVSITPPLTMTSGKTKRKSVTWAPDGQLESIRLIERAVYDGDPVDVSILFPFFMMTYSTLMSRILVSCSYRVFTLHTVCAIWIGVRALLYMLPYSRKLSIGRTQ